MNAVTAMVVEDSPVSQRLLVETLRSDRRLRVIAAVGSGETALHLAPRLRPDVISMDVRLPGISGIEATRLLMRTYPVPIIVVAADLSHETVNSSFEAIRAGALTVVEKPRLETPESWQEMAHHLCDQFVNLSQVKMVRHRTEPARPAPSMPPPVLPAGDGHADIGMVGIVASTGGPPAVASLLRGLPPGFEAPILLVQHMGAGFVAGYAAWLAEVTGRRVTLARAGETPRSGTVLVGPPGFQMRLAAGRIALTRDTSERGHVPSGDVLLHSLAALGPRAVGVILTGMGEDGAAGLLAMRMAGAATLVQDRATCAVYGMPAAALALGAAVEELPIGAIPTRLARLAPARMETVS